jgi:D-alanyl-D-alanine carboxypeptidase-like protein
VSILERAENHADDVVEETVTGADRSARPRQRRRATRGRRWTVAVVVLFGVVGGSVLAFGLLHHTGIERVCGRPSDLRTRGDVTLAADAMSALARAQAEVGHRITVVQSYRSCRQQALACERICGTRAGCPGRCAPPGLSWHQRGLAIDVTQGMLDAPGVITALEDSGWCQAVPASDPGHFSFDGCH